MLCMAVDHSEQELEHIAEKIKILHPDASIVMFQDPLLAFQYAFQNEITIAYVNTKLQRISGFELSKMLLSIEKQPQVILLDTKEEDRKDALRIGVAGYVVKPVTVEKLKQGETMEW